MNVGPYMKGYDECICVYNRRGYLSQHCKPSRTKIKNISVQKKRTSLVSHLFSSLRSSPNAYINELRYLKIKRSHHYYQRERNGGVGKNLRMPENFLLRCVHENCWCSCHCPYMARTIKVANFQQYVERHFLTFVQSMISESTITRLDLIWNTYSDQSLTRLTQDKRGCRTKVQVSTPIPGD